jgi:hypothetical protein
VVDARRFYRERIRFYFALIFESSKSAHKYHAGIDLHEMPITHRVVWYALDSRHGMRD